MPQREPVILINPDSPDGCIIPPRSEALVEIPGVPDSITRKAYTDMIATYGFDPKSLRALRFTYDGVYAEVYAENDKGRRLYDPLTEECIVHDVFVPVQDDDGDGS